jgi:hypothetical protein
MHVGAYRAKLARAAERMLDEDLVWQIGAPEESPAGAPVLPEKVATCVGRPVTADEVRRYAAAPLRDREAELVAACGQFELDPPKPLVLERTPPARTQPRAASRRSRAHPRFTAEVEREALTASAAPTGSLAAAKRHRHTPPRRPAPCMDGEGAARVARARDLAAPLPRVQTCAPRRGCGAEQRLPAVISVISPVALRRWLADAA